MKRSFYNIEESYRGKHIVFNLKNTTCVILDDDEYLMYRNGDYRFAKDDLEQLGIIVDDNADEKTYVVRRILNNAESSKHELSSFYVYTTTGCNARCPYCYETGCTTQTMDIQTAAETAEYILGQVDDAKRLHIIWFGGEPLLNTAAIDVISRKISESLESSDIVFSSSMYTNGFLLNDNLIERAKTAWHLKAIQITLDGLKDSYERIKGFGSANSFEHVISNIRRLLSAGIIVQARLNYDEATFPEILELIDFLNAEFGPDSGLRINAFKVISSDNEDNSKRASTVFDNAIFRKLIEAGFCDDVLGSIKRNMSPCTAGSENNFSILPNGEIIKCTQVMTNIVGSIHSGVDSDLVEHWYRNRLNHTCYECQLLPVCGGGCIKQFMDGKYGCMASEENIRFKLQLYLRHLP